MKRLCLICARAGSVGVKDKNIKPLCGKPLLAHSILHAKKSNLFDIITVSSDSPKILDIAKQYGADYLIKRPADLATSTSAKIAVWQHALTQTENFYKTHFEIVVDLDATSPLRTTYDIQKAVELLESTDCENVITGSPARRSPYFNLVEATPDGKVSLVKKAQHKIVRRQDTPPCYDMNASIYVWRRDKLLQSKNVIGENTLIYVMPEERSIDIDSKLDFMIVELLMSQRKTE